MSRYPLAVKAVAAAALLQLPLNLCASRRLEDLLAKQRAHRIRCWGALQQWSLFEFLRAEHPEFVTYRDGVEDRIVEGVWSNVEVLLTQFAKERLQERSQDGDCASKDVLKKTKTIIRTVAALVAVLHGGEENAFTEKEEDHSDDCPFAALKTTIQTSEGRVSDLVS